MINRFKLKQNDVAEKVGKDRATIANILRLLNLPEAIQESLSSGKISQGHAKVLLSVPLEEQLKFFEQIVDKGLSVRALEAMINGSPEKTDDNVSTVTEKKKSSKEAHIKDMEHKLVQMLGTRVEIKHAGTKGRIEITYYSLEDFERIVEKFK